MRILTDPDARLEIPPGMKLVPLQFYGRGGLPKYPAGALEAGIGGASITVRVLFRKDAHVGEILQSPLAPPYEGPYAAEFRAAVEEAVRAWDFVPPELQTLGEPLDVDEDGTIDLTPIKSREYVSIRLDLSFTFEIVDRKGIVRRSEPAEAPRDSGEPRR